MGITSSDLQNILRPMCDRDMDLKNMIVYADGISFNYGKAATVAIDMSDYVIKKYQDQNIIVNTIKNIFKAVLYDLLKQSNLNPPINPQVAAELDRFVGIVHNTYNQIKPSAPIMAGPNNTLKTQNFEGVNDGSMSSANDFINSISEVQMQPQKDVNLDGLSELSELSDSNVAVNIQPAVDSNKHGAIHQRGKYMEKYIDHEIVIDPYEIKTSPVVRTKNIEIYKNKPEIVKKDLQLLLEPSNVVVFGDSSILAKTTVNKTVHLAYNDFIKDQFITFVDNHKRYKEELLNIENIGVTVDYMEKIVDVITKISDNAVVYSDIIKAADHIPDVYKIEMLGFVSKYLNIITNNIYDVMCIGLDNGDFHNGAKFELEKSIFLPSMVSKQLYPYFLDATGVCDKDAFIRNAFALLTPNVCKLHFSYDKGIATFKEHKVSITTDIDFTETYNNEDYISRKTFGYAADVISDIFDFLTENRQDTRVVLCIGGIELKLFKASDMSSPIYY